MKLHGQCRFAPCSQTEALLVRHGLDTLWRGRLYRESYAPDCWLNPSVPVPFRLTHDDDETTIGQVMAVAASGQWHHASFMIDDPTPEVRERLKVGARVSLGAQSLRCYEDTEPNVVRHTLVRLEEIVLVEDGAIPGILGARITDLREVKADPKPATRTAPAQDGWRSLLPAGWESLRNVPGYELPPGTELMEGPGCRVVYRWTGSKFAAA
jgi:hypothetical protein